MTKKIKIKWVSVTRTLQQTSLHKKQQQQMALNDKITILFWLHYYFWTYHSLMDLQSYCTFSTLLLLPE